MHIFIKRLFFLSIVLFFCNVGYNLSAATHSIPINIAWYNAPNTDIRLKMPELIATFKGGSIDSVPHFKYYYPSKEGVTAPMIKNVKEQVVSFTEPYLNYKKYLKSSYSINLLSGKSGRELGHQIDIIPVRVNDKGEIVKIISGDIVFEDLKLNAQSPLYIPEIVVNKDKGLKRNKKSLASSVLAKGTWFKFPYTNDGVYKLSIQDLKDLGLNPYNINKKDIAIFAKQQGVLPEYNGAKRDDDLVSIPFMIDGSPTGNFNDGEKIIYYAEGPHRSGYSKEISGISHDLNVYTDTAYVFLSVSGGGDQKIMETVKVPNSTKIPVDIHLKSQWQEYEKYNDFIKNVRAGTLFTGEEFDKQLEWPIASDKPYTFSFPDRVLDSNFRLRVQSLFRSLDKSTITIQANDNIFKQVGESITFEFLDSYASINTLDKSFLDKKSNDLNLRFSYVKPLSSSQAWLNWIEVSSWCKNTFNGKYQTYYFPQNINDSVSVLFNISQNSSKDVKIWDVRNWRNPKNINFNTDANGVMNAGIEKQVGDIPKIACFNVNELASPGKGIYVPNQDLHGMSQANYVIVYHPDFRKQAEALKAFHDKRDDLITVLVTPQQIFNEFSCGRQDPTALRDFFRSLYNRNQNDPTLTQFKYVCLFGKASFDYKNKFPNNTNYVPSFQKYSSLDPGSQVATDGYFTFLDPNEGRLNDGEQMDIGIGRITAENQSQADIFINKLNQYQSEKSLRPWRLDATFLADDEDWNTYFNNAEALYEVIDSQDKFINFDKIYIDAFKQYSTPAGNRYPDANDAVDHKMNAGSLTFNYIGHGSERGIAHEKVITDEMVNGWTNIHGLPVFVTASCEISRFDDPTLVSFGEKILFQPKGGSIALMSTTRVVLASGNSVLTDNIYSGNIFERESNGRPRRLGDIFKLAINRTQDYGNSLKFILLGDPAMEIGLPIDSVVTESINGTDIRISAMDTIKALSEIKVKGFIKDISTGKIDENFNGIIYPTVYDKVQTFRTLRNDATSYVANFKLQKAIIYRGTATVKNGRWEFSFNAPKDISYTFSKGKISYYAQNGYKDAGGETYHFKIGGSTNRVDNQPPKVRLFINDTFFKNGGISNQNPILIAKLSDDLGINTVGLGIGHEISTWMNGKDPITMNDFYTSNIDDSKSGTVTYPYQRLADGNYSLRMRAWDISNNFGEGTIDFKVINSSKVDINNFVSSIAGGDVKSTTISFEHNGNENILSANVYIYDMAGRLVKVLNANSLTGSSHGNIKWNLLSDGGGAITAGVYTYTLVLTNSNGEKKIESKKLIVTGTDK